LLTITTITISITTSTIITNVVPDLVMRFQQCQSTFLSRENVIQLDIILPPVTI